MATAPPDIYDTYEENMSAYSEIVAFAIVIPLAIIHATKLYSDFFTPERKVLDYRRQKPKITPGYKKMAYLTYSSILLYAITTIITTIEYNFAKGSCKVMLPAAILDKAFFISAKTTLYIILIYRLHEVYNESAYGYSKKTLTAVGIFVIVANIASFIFIAVFSATHPVYYDDTDTSFPFYCQILPDEPWINIVGAFQGLVDITLCTGSMIFFIIPLNKVVKACKEYDSQKSAKKDTATGKRLHKMMYTGYKYKILVMVAAISTLIWLVLVVAGQTAIGVFIAHIDHAINPICLLLMTQYYPSDKYYETLCFLCIFCCDPKRESYQSQATKDHVELRQDDDTDSTVKKESLAPSVDTDMAIKHKVGSVPYAADGGGYDGSNAEKNLATFQQQNKEITPAPPPQETGNDATGNDTVIDAGGNDPDDANL